MKLNQSLFFLLFFLPIACYCQYDWIFPFYEDGMYGYTNSSGDTVVKAIFQEASPTLGKLGIVKVKGRYGYINNEGKIVIKPKFDSATPFDRGVSYAKKKKKTYGFHSNGERVTHSIAVCGMAYCYEPNQDEKSILSDSLEKKGVVYQRYDLHSKTFMADTLTPEFDSIFPIGRQVLGIRQEKKIAILFVNAGMESPQSIKDGMKFDFDDIKLFKCAMDIHPGEPGYEPIIGYKQGNLWGYIDVLAGIKILTKPKYLTISSLGNKYALVEFSPQRFGYIDDSGMEYFER